MKKKVAFLHFILLSVLTSHAEIYQVGSTRIYASPYDLYLSEVLKGGDTIEIDAE